MLHLRKLVSPAWLWFSTSDPGLLRLQLAARGTLSVTLNTVAALLLAPTLGVLPFAFAPGIVLGLMGPFLMREPTALQRRRTLVLLLIPAVAATTVATLLAPLGIAGAAVLLVLVFGCFLLQGRNPRGVALGLVAVVEMYVGLYLRLPAETIPAQLLSCVLGVPLTALACFALLPMRPAWTLRRTVGAVGQRAAAVLRQARAGQSNPRALRGSLARLNEAALAADDQLAFLNVADRDPARLWLIQLELAVAHLAEDVPDPRGLRLHERRLRHARWAPGHAAPARSGLPPGFAELARAASRLRMAAAQAGAFIPVTARPPPPGPLAWRTAIRVTLASALAMAGGMALSEQRWFWAVITTYVVFLGGRSRGDTLVKGAQRLGGTLLGLVAGLLIAAAVGPDPVLLVAALLLSVFGMYYTFLSSYTVGIFCVTVLLGLLYSLLGAELMPLLVLRLEETAIGTAAAIATALLVLPARTRSQVTLSGRAVLAAVAEVVRASRLAAGGDPAASPLDAMRKLDRQVADLRLALLPLTVGRLVLRRSALERPVPALLQCVHWARVLAVSSQGRTGEVAAEQAARIEARLAHLSAASGAAPDAGALAAMPACTALDHLDRAVAVLAERLAIRAHEGFALDG